MQQAAIRTAAHLLRLGRLSTPLAPALELVVVVEHILRGARLLGCSSGGSSRGGVQLGPAGQQRMVRQQSAQEHVPPMQGCSSRLANATLFPHSCHQPCIITGATAQTATVPDHSTTHLLLCPVSMFLMLLTRWKMPPPPPPEPPSAAGALPPIRLPLLAVRLCMASCTYKCCAAVEATKARWPQPSLQAGICCQLLHKATPDCSRALLASMLLVLGLRE